jgi:hypothetical protein
MNPPVGSTSRTDIPVTWPMVGFGFVACFVEAAG